MPVPYIILYAVEASTTLAILFTIHWILLRKTTFHHFNRLVLLLLVALTFLLPLVSRVVLDRAVPINSLLQEIGGKAGKYFSTSSHSPGSESTPFSRNLQEENTKLSSRTGLVAGAIYCLGMLFFLARIFFQLSELSGILRKGRREHFRKYTIVHIQKKMPPLSFFRWIILNTESYPENMLQHIILHEKVHVRQYHTLDILLMELFAAIFWFHPMAWNLKKLAKLNLEYIADKELLNGGVSRKEYQYDLVRVSFGRSLNTTANYFNYSHLKNRIAMMNIKPSGPKTALKYLFFLPAVFLLVVTLGPLNAQNNLPARRSGANEPKTDNMDIYLVIKKDMTDMRLKTIQKSLSEEGIDISFSDVQYGKDHLLSGIRIIINKGNWRIGDLTVSGQAQPLSEPLVFYFLKVNGQNKTGLSRGYPEDISEKSLSRLKNLNGLLKYQPATRQ
ncbi:MAG TPA: M56 family metallopeptidase, partial [Puia sp.]|nr:M56 family metallopeptidase [Puia sp.]